MTLAMRTSCCSVLAAVALSCRDELAPSPRSAAQAAQVGQGGSVLEGPPADLTFRSEATWAQGTVRYLGAKLSPERPRPGQQATIAHYFRAEAPPPRGYRFFMHLLDEGGQMITNLDHEIQGGALPLERWPVGKVVEDVFALTVPPAGGRIVVGFWVDGGRLPVDQPAAHDGQMRMLGPSLAGAQRPLPEYRVGRTSGPITIDGELSEPGWTQAQAVTLRGSLDGREVSLRTEARLLYDDEALYVGFEVEDPDIWATLTERDDPLYTEEVVEIFLDANADGRTYNELQLSPTNVLFDAYFPARRQGMDLGFDSQAQTAVKVRGTVNQPADQDQGWTAELRIPFAPLAEVPNRPPNPGDRWRFNLYRLEHLERGREGGPRIEGQAFSPLFVGDFHHLPRFAWLIFE
jgi:hypothetical protein